MEFKKYIHSPFLVGETKKGNTIAFVPISEDKLVILNEKEKLVAKKEPGTKDFIYQPKPTKLVFYCNFYVSAQMADELDKSKIIRIDELCNDRKQIIAYPLTFFDFVKLQDILFDLTLKFDL